jgi:hypothetical protein
MTMAIVRATRNGPASESQASSPTHICAAGVDLELRAVCVWDEADEIMPGS